MLAGADFDGLGATVTVSGITADGTVLVSPADDDSRTAWLAGNLRCTAQDTDTLTFTADSVPAADITVNVLQLG